MTAPLLRKATIVVLDGYTLNPGDLNLDELKALGPCEIFDRTPPGEVAARAARVDNGGVEVFMPG